MAREPHRPATPDEELLTFVDPAAEAERLARVQRELERAFAALDDIGPAVSIFGSARAREGDPVYELARETARLLGEGGYAVVTGGGPGVMEAANRGAREAGVRSVGLNIELPFEQAENPYVDLGLTFHYFFTRKLMFVRYVRAFVVFPGGYGTLDELFEALTLIQTGKIHHFPVVLAAPDHWGGLLDWLRDRVAAAGMISPSDLELVRLAEDPAAVVQIVKTHTAEQVL